TILPSTNPTLPNLSVSYGAPLAPLPGIVRDVTVAENGRIFAAVDGWGLCEVDPATDQVTAIVPLSAANDLQGNPAYSYAHHVDTTIVNDTLYDAVGGHSGTTL